ncbi:MAG: DNA polymerase III subunit gamma/tau [Clostridia bacterium]|nr:DNA polymerase III subunit gamma/tau [Clostridia bacterium]
MYQALYRRYRPKVFADVVGQDHITTTLKNEIKEGRIAHAYLFTGTRGTGKTTCAKIFAKAVNCLSPRDGEPCGECSVCRAIENESILDVIEMDAASNSGVDNIRDLIDDISVSPMTAKYKVYIIDEVHALSANAFNALLKTLEEPPAHAIFILATTEVHKLSATILSRCQRFDFRRVSADTTAGVLSRALTSSGIPFDDEAVLEVARLGNGSVRDALSVLERCISANERLTREHVLSTLGMASDEMLMTFMDCFYKKDLTRALSLSEEAYNEGKNISVICERLIWMCRCVLVAKSEKEGAALIKNTESSADAIIAFSKRAVLTDVLRWAKELSETLDRLPRSISERIAFEMCLIRLCERRLSGDEETLGERVARLEDMIASGSIAFAADDTPKAETPASKADKPAQKAETPAPKAETPASKAERPAPKAETPAPEADKSAPKADPPAPKAETPAPEPEKEAPEPEKEAQADVQPAEEPDPDEKPADDTAEDGLPFGRYAKTIAEVMKKDPMTGSMLKNTAAYAYKTHIEIVCPNGFTRDMVNDAKKLIESVISAQLGKKMKMEAVTGEIKPRARAKKTPEPDPLDLIIEYDEERNVSLDDLK